MNGSTSNPVDILLNITFFDDNTGTVKFWYGNATETKQIIPDSASGTTNTPANAYDGNWMTYTEGNGYVWENYTIPDNAVAANVTLKGFPTADGGGVQHNCWNWTGSDWSHPIYENETGNIDYLVTKPVFSDCLSGGDEFRLRTRINKVVVQPRYYESEVEWRYTLLNSTTSVVNSSSPTYYWTNLSYGTSYDFYFTITDGINNVTSPVFDFMTTAIVGNQTVFRNSTILEGSRQEIRFILEKGEHATFYDANLVWRNMSLGYSSFLDNTTHLIINKTFYTPCAINSSIYDFTEFYWNVTLNNSGVLEYYTSPAYNQTNHQLFINTSGGPGFKEALNFTLYDEENQTSNLSGSLNIFFNLFNENCSREIGYEMEDSSNYKFYIWNWTEYRTNGMAEFYNENYPTRFLFMRNWLLNTTNNYDLLLLEDDLAYEISLEVLDKNRNPQTNVIIEAQRYWVGQNKYSWVGSTMTDDNGVGLINLKAGQVWYKFTLRTFDGTFIKTTEPILIITTTPDPIFIEPTREKGYFEYMNAILHSCNYQVTGGGDHFITCEVQDPQNYLTSACLDVKVIEIVGYTNHTYSCDDSLSMTLMANITDTYRNNQTVQYWLRVTGSDYLLDSGSIEFGKTVIYGTIGILMAFMLFLIITMFGIYNPQTALALGGFAMIIVSLIGLIPWTFSLVGLILFIAILVYKAR
jgi:hypothetical protein